MKFHSLSLHPDVMQGIDSMGFTDATPVQESAIPTIMSGNDLIACAQTGTGKTAAFLIPVLHKLAQDSSEDHHIQAMIIVPTRELARQIDQQLEGLAYFTSISSIPIYGGSDGSAFTQEKAALTKGADIVVCTPGRLIAHLKMGYVKTEGLKCLILDEADRMLDMGFHDDIMRITSHLPKKRQTLMFSATMPPKIRELAKKLLNQPEEITIALSKPPEQIVQAAFIVYENQKLPLIEHLLTNKPLKSVIVFCSTKESAKKLNRTLQKHDLKVNDIHSDLDQSEREKYLRQFKNRELHIMVATDILSRGIDVEDVELVINYDVPRDGEDYIHRIGRTARAASTGVAFTLVNESDQYYFSRIEQLLGEPVPKAKLPASIGEGPAYNPKSSGGKRPFKRSKKRRK